MNLDVDVQLHLFDTMVLPIALYGSEIWGHVNFEMIERLHLQFCKILLKVKKCTPTCMVSGELGRLPIQYNIESRMLCFWFKCIFSNNNRFANVIYQLMYQLHVQGIYSAKWIMKIENTLRRCSLSNVWENQHSLDLSFNQCKKLTKDKLGLENMQNSSKCFFL